MNALSLALIVFAVSIVMTGVMRLYALKFNVIDVANQRSSHEHPTPRGGGLAIVIAFYVGLIYAQMVQGLELEHYSLFWSALAVAAIGFCDDHAHIPAKWRLLVHLLAAAWVMLSLSGLPPIQLYTAQIDLGIVGYIIGIGGITWSLNLFNFMDGTDGIAASEALFVPTALASLMMARHAELEGVAVMLSAAAAGFLCWNWPKAKIFMGDVSSGFLGFVIGILILIAAHSEPQALYAGMILFGVFIVDASYTLLYRCLDGQNCLQAHCSHTYQLLAKRYGHLKLLSLVWLVNIGWLYPIAYLVMMHPHYNIAGLLLAYLPLLFIAHALKAGRIQIQ